VALGNPRLGFVCTGQVAAGDAALSGYYIEEARDLAPEDRLQFTHETPPPPGPQPVLSSDSWPAERRARAAAGYAREYARSLIIAAGEMGGLDALLVRAARQVGLQFGHLPGAAPLPVLAATPLGETVAAALAEGIGITARIESARETA
jgi:hypothetical protein